jgi:hypothetical protein
MKPWLKYTAFVISALFFIGSNGQPAEPVSARAYTRQVSVEQMWPDQRGGKAYKLTYQVQLPIDTCWKFKTDFRNEFILTNKYIREHRLTSGNGDTARTEDKYPNAPDLFFCMGNEDYLGFIPIGVCTLKSRALRAKVQLWLYTTGTLPRRDPSDAGGLSRFLGGLALV